MNDIIKYVNNKYININDFPVFSSGDTIVVYYEIKEGDKIRIQSFKGVVIQIKGSEINKTFTIRKITHGFGVERIFMFGQTIIKKIEIIKYGKVRRKRIYYFRKLKGKKARIKEKQIISKYKNIKNKN